MAITAANVLTRVADILLDPSNTRWTAPELLRWLNDGRRETCALRPDIYAVVATVTLVDGTKQTIPADGATFLDAIRNIKADDSPGRAVRIVEREVLDAQNLDWHSGKAGVTKNFMFDERTPLIFMVYPQAAAGQKLEIAYARSPVDITNTADVMTEEDIYTNALVDYVLYRCFSKDAEFAANQARADNHYQRFLNALGFGIKTKVATSPNTFNQGGTPPRVETGA